MIHFKGYTEEILEGAKILFADRTEELTIYVQKEGQGLGIDRCGNDICIRYNKKAEFFRAMVLLLEDHGACRDVHIQQTPKFKPSDSCPNVPAAR